MPAQERQLSQAAAARLITDLSFGGDDAGLVGLELEALTVDPAAPSTRPSLSRLQAAVDAAGALPRGGAVSFEPGGQVELSTRPHRGPQEACDAAGEDAAVLEAALSSAGLAATSVGADPARDDERVLDTPRYRAMERHFDSVGPAGRSMMCGTAALQVNVDLGAGPEAARRWKAAHANGPALAAAFANSPVVCGAPTGWRSARLRTWWAVDPDRTRPVIGHDPVAAWAGYALDAGVILIRASEDRFVPVVGRFPLRAWIDQGHELGWPTADDVAYHLTTLFPPIRPRRWLELRYLDALPAPLWAVAALVLTALVVDEEAGERAAHAGAGSADWVTASRLGLAHPGTAMAARACIAAAIGALPRLGVRPETVDEVARFADRYTARGRCPGDDVYAAWERDRAVSVGAGWT